MSEKCYYLALMNSPSWRRNLISSLTRLNSAPKSHLILGSITALVSSPCKIDEDLSVLISTVAMVLLLC